MCTAATYQTKNAYFGRNLDYEFSYGEEAVIIPRNFPLYFREAGVHDSHYAIIGVAYVAPTPAATLAPNQPANTPLLYDAINEKGLGMAGLNFVGNAVYNAPVEGKDNVAQFEFPTWILSQCATVAEARKLLENLNLRNLNFSDQLPVAELHWIISDNKEQIVVESVADGLKIYDNPVGVLTNNPPFDEQLFHLNNYLNLTNQEPVNRFAPNLPLRAYSRGMGAIGLPGDLSSQSRFVKAAFTKLHSKSANDELSSVSQFFHILHSVDQQYGCCDLGNDKYEHTLYSSCYNLEQGIFYYTTYNDHQISAISLNKTNLDTTNLIRYPMIETEQVNYQN